MKTAIVNFEDFEQSHIYKMLNSFVEIAHLTAFQERLDLVNTEERQYVINAMNSVINTTASYSKSFSKQIACFILGFYAPSNIKEAEVAFCEKYLAELKLYLNACKFREQTSFNYKDETDSVYSSYMLIFYQELIETVEVFLSGLPILIKNK